MVDFEQISDELSGRADSPPVFCLSDRDFVVGAKISSTAIRVLTQVLVLAYYSVCRVFGEAKNENYVIYRIVSPSKMRGGKF